MNRLIKHYRRRGFASGIVVLSLWISLCCFSNPVFAQPTVPVLVDYFDTGTFSSISPDGITYISTTKDFAIVDDAEDKVFIVNHLGVKLSEFDTTAFGSSRPRGITFIPPTGNFAIVDDLEDEVYIVNSSGTLQDHFGTKFVSEAATGIAFDSHEGNFHIVDQTADEVFALNAEGHLLTQFSTITFGSTSPIGITHISGTDNFAIVDDADDDVFIVNSAGVLQSQCDISVFSNYPSGIAYIPVTVADFLPVMNNAASSVAGFAIVDLSDKLFIIDTNCNLLGQFDLATFGINSISPSGITYLSTNELIITDNSRNASFIFNTSYPGKLQGQFGLVILGATYPRGITLISSTGNFAIVCNPGDEVSIVNYDGALQYRFDTAQFSLNPQGITFDANNEVFAIVDSTDDEVTLLDLPVLTRSQPSGSVVVGVTIGPPQAANVSNKKMPAKKRSDF